MAPNLAFHRFTPFDKAVSLQNIQSREGSYADIGLALEKAQLGGDLETEDSGMFRIQIVGTFDQNKTHLSSVGFILTLPVTDLVKQSRPILVLLKGIRSK